MSAWTFGNGWQEVNTFSNREFPQTRSLNGTKDGNVTMFSLGYYSNGNIQTANDYVNANWSYAYDSLNRLCAANQSTTRPACGQPSQYNYVYDQFGNLKSGIGSLNLGFSQNNNHMDGFSYDAAGNLKGDGNCNYTYDAENRITQVTPFGAACTAASYVYNADGLRVQQTVGSKVTNQLFDLAGRQIKQFDGTGADTGGDVFAAGRHIARYTEGTMYFIHPDWLGTERLRSTLPLQNSQGTWATWYEKCTSNPYGDGQSCIYNGVGSDLSPLHFTGKPRDAESNLDWFGARYYSSQFGRFMTPDWSAKPMGIPYAKLDDPQTLNLYAYVGNNPVSRLDRDGHYNCQGTQQQCQTFKNAFAIVQKADSSLKEGSKERKQLDTVVKFYGKDDGKGPTIKFANLGADNAVGETVTNQGKTTITFDDNALNHFGQAGKGDGRAYAHRIPLAGLKCLSERRRTEMELLVVGGRGK